MKFQGGFPFRACSSVHNILRSISCVGMRSRLLSHHQGFLLPHVYPSGLCNRKIMINSSYFFDRSIAGRQLHCQANFESHDSFSHCILRTAKCCLCVSKSSEGRSPFSLSKGTHYFTQIFRLTCSFVSRISLPTTF